MISPLPAGSLRPAVVLAVSFTSAPVPWEDYGKIAALHTRPLTPRSTDGLWGNSADFQGLGIPNSCVIHKCLLSNRSGGLGVAGSNPAAPTSPARINQAPDHDRRIGCGSHSPAVR